jgi:hypothetical protein
MHSIQVMMDMLNSFESPDAIADFLTKRGIKGELQDRDYCVLSNWFLNETDATGCSTTETNISVEEMDGWDYRTHEMVPNAVTTEFIQKFDAGVYPQLICEDCG